MAKTAEDMRLHALRSLNLLDTPPSANFDRITRMASQIFNLPIAAISLTDSDRQWFKSRVGVDHWTIPRDNAPCAEVAETSDLLVIPDFSQDKKYCASLLGASGIRFYAGAPLTTRDGYCLGALCVLGTEPRSITEEESLSLQDLASLVMSQIELQHSFGRIEPLSGLPNRLQMFDDLADLVRDQPKLARMAVMLDLAPPHQLERLSTIMGPTYFDTVIKDAARLLQEFLGPDATPYHVGAGQFVFLAAEGVSEEACHLDIARLLSSGAIGSELRYSTRPVAGLAPFTAESGTADDLLRSLFSAVHEARASDELVGSFSLGHDQTYRRTFRLLYDFPKALTDPEQLRLVFQPRFDLSTNRIVSAEALLRWTHPELGEISPAEFVPIIETSLLTRPMTQWVLNRALEALELLHGEGLPIGLSVNISAANLNEANFVEDVSLALARHRIAARWLELELTETCVMQDGGQALLKLQQLADLGISLAIDDFGTGYSSLSYLHKLPIDVIKIDRSFISGLADGSKEQTLVQSMIRLAADLGHRVVAEGIETATAAEVLRGMQCDEGQGYYFARPVPREALFAMAGSARTVERVFA